MVKSLCHNYYRYLSREADQAGIDHWVPAFDDGPINADQITGFLASDEYFANLT